jgi:cathepsin B
VTGGKYNSHKGCKPYPIRPDPKADAPKDTQCIKTCKSSYNKDYDNDKIKGTDQIPFAYNNKGVMDEIMTNGPVISEFRLYEDFYNYSGGIYQYKEGKLLGYYYAKILAWGEDEGVKFWSAAASFGSNWGKKLFKKQCD